MKYQKYTASERQKMGDKGIDLLEWGLVFLKSSIIFQIGGVILILINRMKYGFLLIALALFFMLIADILKRRSIKIMIEAGLYDENDHYLF